MSTKFWQFVIRPPVAIIKSTARLVLFLLETYNLYSIASKLTVADRRLIWYPNTGVRKANRHKLLTFYCMWPLNWKLRPGLIMPTAFDDSLFCHCTCFWARKQLPTTSLPFIYREILLGMTLKLTNVTKMIIFGN